jgi:prepilin-type processing-associated H-X9-DG protein
MARSTPLPADTGAPPASSQDGAKPGRPQDANTCLKVGLVVGAVVVFVVVGLGIAGAMLFPDALFSREPEWRAACAGNLKQVARVCNLYANDNTEGYWPHLSGVSGTFMFDADSVHPEFLTDPQILVCPASEDADPPGAIDDHDYYYLGYALTNEDEALAFLGSYPGSIADGVDFTTDLPAPPGRGSFGGDTFLRLRRDVCDGTDVQPSEVPVMFDVVVASGNVLMLNHMPGGSNVLYLDGHVEFVTYPDRFPLSLKFLEALSELDR